MSSLLTVTSTRGPVYRLGKDEGGFPRKAALDHREASETTYEVRQELRRKVVGIFQEQNCPVSVWSVSVETMKTLSMY